MTRAFIVIRDGEERWQVVTGFLRLRPHPLTMKAAKLKLPPHGITRTVATELARRLNEWAEPDR